MRQVVSDPAEAKKRGRAARERMVSQYSPEAVAVKIMAEVNRIKDKLRSGSCDNCFSTANVAAPGVTAEDPYVAGAVPFIPPEDPWYVKFRGTLRKWYRSIRHFIGKRSRPGAPVLKDNDPDTWSEPCHYEQAAAQAVAA